MQFKHVPRRAVGNLKVLYLLSKVAKKVLVIKANDIAVFSYESSTVFAAK